MQERTTIRAERDDLEILRGEAHRKGVSLAELAAQIIAEKATSLRAQHRPRLGLGASGEGVGRTSVKDEASPASTPFRS